MRLLRSSQPRESKQWDAVFGCRAATCLTWRCPQTTPIQTRGYRHQKNLCIFGTRCYAIIVLGNLRTLWAGRAISSSSSFAVSRVPRDGRQDDSISHRLQDKEDQPHHRILPSPFLLRRLCTDPFDYVSPLIFSSFPVVGHLATLSVTRSSDPMPSIISAVISISTRANNIK